MECRGAGAKNLMFWAASELLPKDVTPGQSFVIRHNASLR